MSNNNDMFAKLIETTQKQFSKKFKESETKFIIAEKEKPPTGLIVDNPLLEFILDRRYLAYGRFYLVYGRKGSCKTSLFYDMAKLFHKNNGKVIWLETENAIDLDYARDQGVDLSNVALVHPQSLEEACTMAEGIIRNMSKLDPEGQMPVLVCLDSIAGSTTEYEQDQSNDITDVMPGSHARILSRFYREMEHPLANERCVFLALNQQKEKIGTFGPGEQVSLMGGNAQLFCSTYQWQMARTEDIKKRDEYGVERKHGSVHTLTCMRNKLGREGTSQKIEFNLYREGGIDWFGSLAYMLDKYYPELVSKTVGSYTWKPEGMTYIDDNGNTQSMNTVKGVSEQQMGKMIQNSTQAKEAIRNVFGIRPMPSEEEIKEVETARLAKRKKKDEEKSL